MVDTAQRRPFPLAPAAGSAVGSRAGGQTVSRRPTPPLLLCPAGSSYEQSRSPLALPPYYIYRHCWRSLPAWPRTRPPVPQALRRAAGARPAAPRGAGLRVYAMDANMERSLLGEVRRAGRPGRRERALQCRNAPEGHCSYRSSARRQASLS